jgi:hypothetical protein
LALRQPPRERKTKEKQKQGEHAQICARGDYPSEARAVAAVLNAGRRA